MPNSEKHAVVEFLLSRSAILYLIVAILLALLVSPRQASLNRLNALLNVEEYLQLAAQGKARPNHEQFYWGVRYYDLVLRQQKPSPYFYHNLGFCYQSLGDDARAMEAYAQAIALNTRLYQSYWNLGVMASGKKDFQKADRYFSQALQRLPSTVQHYVYLVDVLKKKKRERYLPLVRSLVSQAQQDRNALLRAMDPRVRREVSSPTKLLFYWDLSMLERYAQR